MGSRSVFLSPLCLSGSGMEADGSWHDGGIVLTVELMWPGGELSLPAWPDGIECKACAAVETRHGRGAQLGSNTRKTAFLQKLTGTPNRNKLLAENWTYLASNQRISWKIGILLVHLLIGQQINSHNVMFKALLCLFHLFFWSKTLNFLSVNVTNTSYCFSEPPSGITNVKKKHNTMKGCLQICRPHALLTVGYLFTKVGFYLHWIHTHKVQRTLSLKSTCDGQLDRKTWRR